MIDFAKGHGTENDFVIIDDLNAELELTPTLVSALCDRRAGIGADGLLRVATAGALLDAGVIPALEEGIERETLFMDYYNADGSTAQMCGNGTRVFAHWVRSTGIVHTPQFIVGTRAGAKRVEVHDVSATHADVSVEMGNAEVTGVSTCHIGEQRFAGMAVDMGNPHLACVVPNATAKDIADLQLAQPEFDAEFFPEGVNVEVLTALDDGAVHMRVWERGVGETHSCGTGTVAAARAALADAGSVDGSVAVHVRGGIVQVTINGEQSTLRGPSIIHTRGQVDPQALVR